MFLMHEMVHVYQQRTRDGRLFPTELEDPEEIVCRRAVLEGHAEYVTRRAAEYLGVSEFTLQVHSQLHQATSSVASVMQTTRDDVLSASESGRLPRPEELQERVMVTEGGRQRPVSKQRALVKTMTSRALKGDSRAIALLADLAMRLLPQDDETTAAKPLSADDQAILEDFDLRLREDDGPAEEEES